MLTYLPVTPGITALEYHQRRANFANLLQPGDVAVLPSATILYRAKPVFYDFHQEPNFLYLTGWLEPDSVAVIGEDFSPWRWDES